MEKSMARVRMNEKLKPVSNNLVHIPDDLTFSILSKLSIKSLKRFECVCKSWSLLFENPHFMNMLRNHFLSNNRSSYDSDSSNTFLLLGDGEHFKFYLLSNDRFENKVTLDLPLPFQENVAIVYILSPVSINGILCLCQEASRGMVSSFEAALWNPATTEFMVIPTNPDELVPPYRNPCSQFHGFGYDNVTDNYKLIRFVRFVDLTDEDEDMPWEDRSYEPLLEIYSLRSNSWRILEIDTHDIADCDFDQPFLGTGTYIDGVCHWWGNNDLYNSPGCFVSFDLCNEVLITAPMLLKVGGSCHFYLKRRLVVLNESIALISNDLKIFTYHISILGELGVKESWIKLFIVGPMPSIECPLTPIEVGRKGDICFKLNNDELVWIDLSTQIIDEIGVQDKNRCHIGIYKESLLSIGGINN